MGVSSVHSFKNKFSAVDLRALRDPPAVAVDAGAAAPSCCSRPKPATNREAADIRQEYLIKEKRCR
jgi:hypothetical protein